MDGLVSTFDGTLAEYTGFKGEGHVGAPIEPMVRRVRAWLHAGKDVRLFTARKPHPAIRRWMLDNLGTVLPITNTKDSHMQMLLDDRAVQVERNTGVVRDADMQQVLERS
jgi:hypothetical protein